ncbi:hypothetical protein TL10_21135 [Mycolicibacterium llatzerense]|uniref:Uncharacterized protein n=1 Tax=Mycolicibacterium llatzerense TaxID=280871 RepID=A0A0D1L9X9_9MYCO|nr:hypothetical protein TL10_21135 [Mycolicibacterium llatzerense]
MASTIWMISIVHVVRATATKNCMLGMTTNSPPQRPHQAALPSPRPGYRRRNMKHSIVSCRTYVNPRKGNRSMISVSGRCG